MHRPFCRSVMHVCIYVCMCVCMYIVLYIHQGHFNWYYHSNIVETVTCFRRRTITTTYVKPHCLIECLESLRRAQGGQTSPWGMTTGELFPRHDLTLIKTRASSVTRPVPRAEATPIHQRALSTPGTAVLPVSSGCKARSSPHPSALFRPCYPTVRVRRLGAVLTGRNGPRRTRTVANRAGTALTGAVRTGLKDRAAWSML